MQKAELREKGLKARNSLDAAEREAKSAAICSRIIQTPEYAAAKTILLYSFIRSEVQLFALAETGKKDGKTIAYPVCLAEGQMLAACSNAWQKGPYGILEPDLQQGRVIDPREIDLVICPCVAFDEQCRRIGMGAGYYDAFLPRLRPDASVWAAAYEIQKVDAIPADPWDIRMHRVYTESNVYRFAEENSVLT